MLIRATFTLARREDVLAVPAEAVQTSHDGVSVVFVAEADTAVRRVVTPGLEGGGFVELAEGVKEGEAVVVQGQERLRDGAPVKVRGGQR